MKQATVVRPLLIQLLESGETLKMVEQKKHASMLVGFQSLWMGTLNLPNRIEACILEIVRQNISVSEVVVDILPPTNLLNDTSIDLFQTIVHENTDFCFHPTSYFAYHTFVKPYRSDKDMHVIGGNINRHWCCVYYDGTWAMIYDSLNKCDYVLLHEEEKRYLRRRYPHVEHKDIVLQPVTPQPDHYTCGAYAAAFAITIALGGDPVNSVLT